MLNYETILSNYDDKLTLMQWLKKVEDALNNASAVTFNVNKRGDATLTFSIVFEDGSEIESDPLTLQQGESVESAAIVGGHLMLTLTNGDVLDAGNLFNGNVNVTGNVTATGTISAPAIEATGTGIKTDVIQQKESSGIDVYAAIVHLNNGLEAQGEIESLNGIRTPVITADEAEIAAQKPIVEVMTGYRLIYTSSECENIYIGAVKNGNKLTLAFFFKLVPPAASHAGIFHTLEIPSNIGASLVATLVGTNEWIDFRKLDAFSSVDSSVDVYARIRKVDNATLSIIYKGDNFTPNATYYVRYEVTFLLSENLAA